MQCVGLFVNVLHPQFLFGSGDRIWCLCSVIRETQCSSACTVRTQSLCIVEII